MEETEKGKGVAMGRGGGTRKDTRLGMASKGEWQRSWTRTVKNVVGGEGGDGNFIK